MKKEQIDLIEREFNEEPFVEILEHGLSKKERDKIINTEFLVIDEKGDIIISGGGRILLLLLTSHFKTWENMINHAKTKGTKEQYMDILRFRRKEKLYGLNLLKDADSEFLNIRSGK